jgi:hypothetical protein
VALRSARFDPNSIPEKIYWFVDEAQIAWLKADLPHEGRLKLAVVTHIPLVSAFCSSCQIWKTAEIYLVTNAQDVLNVLWP